MPDAHGGRGRLRKLLAELVGVLLLLDGLFLLDDPAIGTERCLGLSRFLLGRGGFLDDGCLVVLVRRIDCDAFLLAGSEKERSQDCGDQVWFHGCFCCVSAQPETFSV